MMRNYTIPCLQIHPVPVKRKHLVISTNKCFGTFKLFCIFTSLSRHGLCTLEQNKKSNRYKKSELHFYVWQQFLVFSNTKLSNINPLERLVFRL